MLHIDAGTLTPYAGGYDYYLEKSRATDAREALVAGGGGPSVNGAAPVQPTAPSAPPSGRKTKEQKRAEAEARAGQSREKRDREERVRKLEREITSLEARQKALTAELESEATYQQPGRPIQLNRELSGVADLLARTTRQWEIAAEQAENTVEA